MYEKYPLIMNSCVGSAVYMAGEITVEAGEKGLMDLNWDKIGKIGTLGATENGILMLTWYTILNKYIGNSVTTPIVLVKCALDQLFFASQSDFLFLLLCAYHDIEQFPQIFYDISDTFITTWIMDCSLWPLVNFFGFSFIPYILQPTYMSVVQYFWQIYISNMASTDSHIDHSKIHAIFDEIDLNHVSTIHTLQFVKIRS